MTKLITISFPYIDSTLEDEWLSSPSYDFGTWMRNLCGCVDCCILNTYDGSNMNVRFDDEIKATEFAMRYA